MAPTTASQSLVMHLQAQIEYPQAGVFNKALFKDRACQQTLFCLAAGADLSEHTSSRNATVLGVEGKGTLTLAGEVIPLARLYPLSGIAKQVRPSVEEVTRDFNGVFC